ncbi:hypothetical protein EFT87_14455 [Schleiferilactobacillus harbinensis]|nr:hypothetical protein [Schleiferilactobacillus harbinensis]MCT2909841.1 hypothetical protein [Schleiferilactobacillus harbinensis]
MKVIAAFALRNTEYDRNKVLFRMAMATHDFYFDGDWETGDELNIRTANYFRKITGIPNIVAIKWTIENNINVIVFDGIADGKNHCVHDIVGPNYLKKYANKDGEYIIPFIDSDDAFDDVLTHIHNINVLHKLERIDKK